MSDQFDLLVDLHIDGERQGPGSDEATRRAIALARLEQESDLTIADIGCGTGASSLVLANDLDAHVTAVDFLPPFLARLDDAARQHGLADRITTVSESMDQLSFEEGSLDVIWSEGAIYNIAFENGISSWRPYLKSGGVLAVSEITWLTHKRPAALEHHWENEYPEVATPSAKLAALEVAGYSPVGYFSLPRSCWRPLRALLGLRQLRLLHRSTHGRLTDQACPFGTSSGCGRRRSRRPTCPRRPIRSHRR